ncbi:hypothetical protein, partial [uncultured Duncaniella sp.]|uniref:hypothetical protein n=1 Tax=uncultured Duncaniella sp. TaxID=2768039 RepID=UPI002638A7C0
EICFCNALICKRYLLVTIGKIEVLQHPRFTITQSLHAIIKPSHTFPTSTNTPGHDIENRQRVSARTPISP